MDGLYIFHGKTKKELIEVLYGFQKTFIPEKWRIFPIDCTDIDIYRDDIPNNDFEFISFLDSKTEVITITEFEERDFK
jgi:hypothetical protein